MPFNPFSTPSPFSSSTSTTKKPPLTSPSPHSPHLYPNPSTYLSNPSSYNPWNPQTPYQHLYRSFRSFTHTENLARATRNEQIFCTPAARDKAFEKLMRLSRGEERIEWAGVEWGDEGEWEEAEWYADGDEDEEMDGEMERDGNGGRAVDGDEDMVMVGDGRGKVEGHGRKDSKEVYHVVRDDEGWRSVQRMRIENTNGKMHVEDVRKGK